MRRQACKQIGTWKDRHADRLAHGETGIQTDWHMEKTGMQIDKHVDQQIDRRLKYSIQETDHIL